MIKVEVSYHKKRIPLTNHIMESMGKNKRCYVCKKIYSFPSNRTTIDSPWVQYPSMCHLCASYNFRKRIQWTDLRGKYAIVTGGRIKIGFCVALMLLRDGCNVIITTRFPKDAADRYQEEKDFDCFKRRLKIYPMDLRNLNGVYRFIEYAERTFPHLDILINNAAQTIRRPTAFFRHLLHNEETPFGRLPDATQSLLATQECLDYGTLGATTSTTEAGVVKDKANMESSSNASSSLLSSSSSPSSSLLPYSSGGKRSGCTSNLKRKHQRVQPKRTKRSRKDSSSVEEIDSQVCCKCGADNDPQTAVINKVGDVNLGSESNSVAKFFPPGLLDEDGQQMDLRPQNSWRMSLSEVPLTELIEVLAVNAVAPFMLTQRLKTCLDKSPAPRRFVINVSAMEGQFNRAHKNHFHPHTNMAKAALNMLTRTAAVEFRDSGVYMTAVDTGWVTDERPYPQAKHEQNKGFILPLDCVDGAARIYDPVVTGLNKRDQEPFSAVFLKDYKPYPW